MPLAVQSLNQVDMTPPALPAEFVVLAAQPQAWFRVVSVEIVREHSPPDLQILNATFLI